MARNATVENESEEKTTRTRVDPATLPPHEKVLVSFNVPAELRVMIRTKATEKNISEAQYMRELVSGEFQYTIPESFNERRGRTGQYSGMSKEEKEAAIKEAAETKRANLAKLLDAIASKSIDVDKLAEMGIDVSLLPKPRANKEDAA